jgi:hypothetical protein
MTPPSTSPALTARSVAMLSEKISAPDFIPASQAAVAGSPVRSRMAATMAWKSGLTGGAPQRPFHSGFSRSMIDVGSWASVSLDVLYAKTVVRAATPVHLLVAGRYCAGTCATVAGSTSANRPAFSTAAMAGEFSVRMTSAGDEAPSAISWLPSSVSPPWR